MTLNMRRIDFRFFYFSILFLMSFVTLFLFFDQFYCNRFRKQQFLFRYQQIYVQKLTGYTQQNNTHMTNSQGQNSVTPPSAASALYSKLIKTMNNTGKSDKYVRLISNICKLVRATSPVLKKKYSSLYKQLLTLRQVIRLQGIYQAIIEINELGWKSLELQNISNISFLILGIFGDTLDRIILILQTLNLKKYQNILTQVDQMQSDCYFLQCIIWLFYHIRTTKKVWKNNNYKQKQTKILKIVKYLIDSMTSYCKFSRRVWELEPKTAAVLGIVSSLIGLYDILK